MSQSFEKKVGSRLQHYEPAPPPHLKKKVLDVVSPSAPSRGINGWQVTGIILIICALLQFLSVGMPGSDVGKLAKVALALPKEEVVQSTQSSIEVTDEPVSSEIELQRKPYTPELKKSENSTAGTDESEMQASQDADDRFDQSMKNEVASNEAYGSIADKEENTAYLYGMIYPQKRQTEECTIPETGEVNMRHLADNDNQMYLLNKVVVPEKNGPPVYIESGLFFLYQQVVPNLEDDLIIESFEGEPGLSPKRLGLHIEGGVYRQLGKRVRLHGGVKASTYQQSYSFVLRDIQVDDVVTQISGDEILFSPVYEQDKIYVDHRLYTAGLRLNGNFQIFPSKTTELLIDSEYQYLVNPDQSFDFRGSTYEVGYSNQWLFSFGMRKTFWLSRKGMVQVLPTIRYSFNQINATGIEALSMKPYSVGLSVSYIFGNFMK